jgi:peptidoglycan/LPS O-acetylase OafA/YrhL
MGCLLLAVGSYLLATTPIAGSLTLGPAAGVQLSARLALSTAVAGFLLAPLVLGRDDAYSAALASRPARSVGTVSYGLFLWHLPVFTALYALTGARFFSGGLLPLLAIGLPVSLLLAWLSWVGVERPAMRWAARRVPHRPAPLPR